MKKHLLKTYLSIFLLVALILFALNDSYPQSRRTSVPDNSECLMCHDDPDISMVKRGKKISLTVKPFTLRRSVHAGLKCSDCHKGFDPLDIPHKPVITPVNCMDCHKDAPKKHVFHQQMQTKAGAATPDVSCKGCHGYHDEVTTTKGPGAMIGLHNSTEFCGKCHKDVKDKHINSVHFVKEKDKNTNAPGCLHCHQKPITENWGFDRATLKVNQEKMCLDCHLKLPKNEFTKSLIDYEKSVHGQALTKGNLNAATCIDCHGSHELRRASDPKSLIHHLNIPDVCGKCHINIQQEYAMSVHGMALKRGNPDVPGCTYCHGEHAITSQFKIDQRVIQDNKMDFSKLESQKMLECVHCHTDAELMKKYNLATVKDAHDWLPNLATHYATVRCVDCHSSYDPPNLSHNLLPRQQVVKKCEECHSKNSILMSKLYKHEKEQSRSKFGFINGTILSDAYVIGTTRNVYLDSISFILFGLTAFGIGLHGFIRWYFRKTHKSEKEAHSVAVLPAESDKEISEENNNLSEEDSNNENV